jgi:hypothetical protein
VKVEELPKLTRLEKIYPIGILVSRLHTVFMEYGIESIDVKKATAVFNRVH